MGKIVSGAFALFFFPFPTSSFILASTLADGEERVKGRGLIAAREANAIMIE
jgi:hypothetical protein